MARPERIRLGDLLIQEQLLSAAQLAEALADQKSSGRKLGRIFVDRGWVTEAQIARSLARQLGWLTTALLCTHEMASPPR